MDDKQVSCFRYTSRIIVFAITVLMKYVNVQHENGILTLKPFDT